MSVTWSINEASFKADAQTDFIPAKYLKALFWYLDGATINTHKLEITEKDGSGHLIYADAAPKTHGAVPIPCPDHKVEGFYIKDMDNGYVFGFPKRR